ncbi:MAG: rhodanese-like domain-containing protein [Saprospiraceae bacterium]|nr:rhodanese-like domain-containing protein [Saprospiraceae bacterium]
MRFFSKKSLLISGLLLLAIACFGQVKSGAYRAMLYTLLSHTVPETGVKEAAELHRNGAIFLDAREPREFEVSRIPGAVPVGYDHFDLRNLPDTIQKDRPVVVYCSVGYRSEKVAEKLKKAGFTRVSNLYGGIFEWVNQGYAVVDATGATQNVHAYDRTWGVWLKKGRKVYK